MKLPDNLKRIRKENNLSQEQLAEKLGVSRQAVSKWESGQSYPEMDKVLLICKLFNFNIDELMNENVKEVNETKEFKIDINKYIDDFFAFLTKTINMLSSMKFREKSKCFIEQGIIIIILSIIFMIIGSILGEIVNGILGVQIYYVLSNILEGVYSIFALVLGTTIFLHIFKIRYLDYYEIVEDKEEISEKTKEENNNVEQIKENEKEEKKKIILEKKKEKIIIRDPEHSQFKFLTGIAKLILLGIKLFVALIALYAIITLIGLVICTVLSFLVVKTGTLFFGIFIGLIAAIIINLIVLEVCYNFIVSRKSKKTRMAISFVISLIFVGIGIGLVVIGITQFDFIEEDITQRIEDTYNFEMKDNLYVTGLGNIKYLETDSNDIKIVVKHSEDYYINVENLDDKILVDYGLINNNEMEQFRMFLKDVNNKQIKNYNAIMEICIYSSKENIELLKQNQYNQSPKIEILNSELEELNTDIQNRDNRIEELYLEIQERDSIIEELNTEIQNKNYIIEELQELN